jgi:hypothetical protein
METLAVNADDGARLHVQVTGHGRDVLMSAPVGALRPV